jgi:hypothetical protein
MHGHSVLPAKQVKREGFALTIVDAAQPGDVPAAVRLCSLLKRLLRTWGFRCTSVVAAQPAEASQAADIDNKR